MEQLMSPLMSAITRCFRRPRRASRARLTGNRKRPRQRPCLEILEDRTVPSATIPVANAGLNALGNVQLGNPMGATISSGTARMTTAAPTQTSFSGTVFNDLNGNGVQDAGEPGLAGWTVWLDDDRDGIFNNNEPSATTNANGNYFLNTTGQPPGPGGAYYLGFNLPVGDGGRWMPTTPIYAYDIPTTEPNAVRNFGVKFQPYGSTGPQGSETAVNTNTAETVSTGNGAYGGAGFGNVANAMSADANGDYVVAWQSQQSGGSYAVSARVFNADGSPKTGELAVGTGTLGTGSPSVSMAGNGQFVVAWQSGSSTISMAVYQLDGTLISNSNTISSNQLQGVAADSAGDFAVLYGGKKDRYGVEQPTVQRYTKSGAANGPAISVATPRLLNYDTAIGMDGNGNFTVSWDDANNGHFVYFQRYTSAGKPNGSTVTVAQSSSETLALRSLAMNSSGQFVETWSIYYPYSMPSSAQVYTAAGSPSGSAVNVTGSTPITTAIDSAGNVTFAWTGDVLWSTGNVHFRQLTAAGQLTPELIANTTTQGSHMAAGVAATGNGAFVISWVGNGAADPAGMYLQRFGSGPQIGSFSASASTVTHGNPLTLSTSNITDPNPVATITQVAFYATDSTGNQYLLGYGTNNNGVRSLMFTVNLAPGSYTLFAEATDSNGILGGVSAPFTLAVS
jgi:hypothetical protein